MKIQPTNKATENELGTVHVHKKLFRTHRYLRQWKCIWVVANTVVWVIHADNFYISDILERQALCSYILQLLGK